MTMTREQVAALLDGTTPGPWVKTSADHPEQGVFGMGYRLARMTGGEIQRDTANASLMTAAPDLARQLLAAMDRLADAEAAQAALVERADIDAALDAMEANMRADGQTTLAWRTEIPPEEQDKLRACVRAGIAAALASDAGVQALAELRAEIADLKLNMDADLKTMVREGAALKAAEADRNALAAKLAEAEAQVAALRAITTHGADAIATVLILDIAAALKDRDRVYLTRDETSLGPRVLEFAAALDAASPALTPAEQQLFDASMAMREAAGQIAKEQTE